MRPNVPQPHSWCGMWWWDRDHPQIGSTFAAIASTLPGEVFDLLQGGESITGINNRRYRSREEAVNAYRQAQATYRKQQQ